MSRIKEIAEGVQLIYNVQFKQFGLQDIIRYKQFSDKNLFEMLVQYPSKGINFKVWRKTWPKDYYWIIHDIDFKDFCHGKIYGTYYKKGKKMNGFPVKMNGCNKRGVWKYDIHDSEVLLSNGLHYSAQEMNQLWLQKGFDKQIPFMQRRQKTIDESDLKYQQSSFGKQSTEQEQE